MLTGDFLKSIKVILSESQHIGLGLVGCGGTGSWLAPAIARVARLLIDRGKTVDVLFIDPDTVEEKNCIRQNFCLAEIRRNKAETLARRYGSAWGITIGYLQERFDGNKLDIHASPIILCGCVDGPAGRRTIHQYITRYGEGLWWLDSGNTQSYGQVLLGRAKGYAGTLKPLSLPGFTNWLPTPADQHPELIDPIEESPSVPLSEGGKSMELSCAEMALRDSQGMAINQRMAAEMADYLVRLLITKDLRKHATYIDLESGSCRSEYITAAKVNKWMKVQR